MKPRIVTQPTAEPLTLGEAMADAVIHLDNREDDEWFVRKIKQAREAAEEFLERSLTDAVYEIRLDRLGTSIALPIGDIGTIVSITYVDEDGVTQTLASADYDFDDNPDAPVVRPAYDVTWPDTRYQANAVTVRFKGRFNETNSPPVSPPEAIKGAMGMMIAHWFANREAVLVGESAVEIPLGVQYLLQPHRLHMGV